VQVLIYEVTPGSWTVMIPAGTTDLHPTPQAAARAAWHTRWHTTPKEPADA
jgi:hypothetical protein